MFDKPLAHCEISLLDYNELSKMNRLVSPAATLPLKLTMTKLLAM
jgi:hypothetical protein